MSRQPRKVALGLFARRKQPEFPVQYCTGTRQFSNLIKVMSFLQRDNRGCVPVIYKSPHPCSELREKYTIHRCVCVCGGGGGGEVGGVGWEGGGGGGALISASVIPNRVNSTTGEKEDP